MSVEIKFPALQLHPLKKTMWVDRSREDFGRCSGVALKAHYFDDMFLVDSSGNAYTFKSVKSTQPASPAWKWPIELLMYGSRLFKVELELSEPESISLEDFIGKISAFINSAPNNWESGIGAEEIKKKISGASSHKDVIEKIHGREIT